MRHLPEHTRLPAAQVRVSSGYDVLARECWHRRKHGLTRRTVWRLHHLAYALLGSSIVANTSGRALGSGTSSQALCLPT